VYRSLLIMKFGFVPQGFFYVFRHFQFLILHKKAELPSFYSLAFYSPALFTICCCPDFDAENLLAHLYKRIGVHYLGCGQAVCCRRMFLFRVLLLHSFSCLSLAKPWLNKVARIC